MRRELLALALLAVVSIVLQATAFGPHGTLPGSTLPAYMDWFAYGMMLAVVSVATRQGLVSRPRTPAALRGRPWLWWLGGAVVFWVLCTQLRLPRNPFNGISTRAAVSAHTLEAACAALLLVPALLATTEEAGRAGCLPAARWRGADSSPTACSCTTDR